MSVEIKCDRCGKPVEPGSDVTPMASRASDNNFEVVRNGKLELRDLCDDCMDDLDIFMQCGPFTELCGSYKPGDLAYLVLTDPSVSVYSPSLIDYPERKPEIHISADLEPLNKLIDAYGITNLPPCAVEQLILGVRIR